MLRTITVHKTYIINLKDQYMQDFLLLSWGNTVMTPFLIHPPSKTLSLSYKYNWRIIILKSICLFLRAQLFISKYCGKVLGNPHVRFCFQGERLSSNPFKFMNFWTFPLAAWLSSSVQSLYLRICKCFLFYFILFFNVKTGWLQHKRATQNGQVKRVDWKWVTATTKKIK